MKNLKEVREYVQQYKEEMVFATEHYDNRGNVAFIHLRCKNRTAKMDYYNDWLFEFYNNDNLASVFLRQPILGEDERPEDYTGLEVGYDVYSEDGKPLMDYSGYADGFTVILYNTRGLASYEFKYDGNKWTKCGIPMLKDFLLNAAEKINIDDIQKRIEFGVQDNHAKKLSLWEEIIHG